MHLHHLHLPNPIPYTHSLRLQEALLERHFIDKAALRKNAALKSHAPHPTLLTFQTHPTYTVGRRHLTANPLSREQITFLTGEDGKHARELATFYPSPRGGLLTYHAPGQLTGYLVLDLRKHGLTPRCYIRMLENTAIRTCARHGVPNTMTTEDPGVWVAERDETQRDVHEKMDVTNLGCEINGKAERMVPTNRKICAIGVQVSRGITSHGIGLNVFDQKIDERVRSLYTLPKGGSRVKETEDAMTGLQEGQVVAPGYLSWGFSRIIACGLEGKSVTWLSREQQNTSSGVKLESVATSLASEVAKSLGVEDGNVERVTREEIEGDDIDHEQGSI